MTDALETQAERDAKTEVTRLNAVLTKAEQVCAELVGRARHHDIARTEAEAERDAAVAAIERVRAIAEDGVWRDTRTPGDWAWALDHMAHKVLAALVGAPEPGWEWAERLWGAKP